MGIGFTDIEEQLYILIVHISVYFTFYQIQLQELLMYFRSLLTFSIFAEFMDYAFTYLPDLSMDRIN